MATLATLRTELATIGAVYGKHPNWASEAAPGFLTVLGKIHDDAIRGALAAWTSDAEKDRPPRPGEVMHLVRANTRSAAQDAPGCCRGCIGGVREVAVHFQNARGLADVDVWSARCTCQAGQRHHGQTYQQLRDLASARHGSRAVVVDPSPLDCAPRRPRPVAGAVPKGFGALAPAHVLAGRASVAVDRQRREREPERMAEQEEIQW